MNYIFHILVVIFLIYLNDIEASFNSSEIEIFNGNYSVSLNGNSSATEEERNIATDVLKKFAKVALKFGEKIAVTLVENALQSNSQPEPNQGRFDTSAEQQ